MAAGLSLKQEFNVGKDLNLVIA
jgi:hypothetical protein